MNTREHSSRPTPSSYISVLTSPSPLLLLFVSLLFFAPRRLFAPKLFFTLKLLFLPLHVLQILQEPELGAEAMRVYRENIELETIN